MRRDPYCGCPIDHSDDVDVATLADDVIERTANRRRLVNLEDGQITLRLPYTPAVPITPDLARRLRNELNATLSRLAKKTKKTPHNTITM